MTLRGAALLVISIATAGHFSFLFFSGLRQRKAVTSSNLVAERERTPILYWTFQAYYAVVVVVCAFGSVLLASGYRAGGNEAVDKLVIAPFGALFLFCALICFVIFVIGLRTGVALRRVREIEPAPPSRKQHPVRYWGLQSAYLLIAIFFATLGATALWVSLK